MEHGDYLTYKINWQKNEMQLCEIGPLLRKYRPSAPVKPYSIPQLVHALEVFAQISPQEGPPYHYLADFVYDGENLFIRIHLTNNFSSVVDVPRERLAGVLRPFLTPRETEVATLLFEGCTIRSIAATLRIAEGTVKRINYNIYRKLGVGSQVELVREIYARLAQLEWPPGRE